jgi:hypothetical protein
MLQRTGQTVTFRRVTGQAPNTESTDATVTALFRTYKPSTPVGPAMHAAEISEGLREFIVLECDLIDANFPVPLAKNDRILLGFPDSGELFNIVEVDYGSRIFAGAIEGKAIGV